MNESLFVEQTTKNFKASKGPLAGVTHQAENMQTENLCVGDGCQRRVPFDHIVFVRVGKCHATFVGKMP